MKTVIVFLTMLSVLQAHAGGYRCHALCVVPVVNDQALYVMGDLEVEAGVGSSEAMSLLRKKCRSVAANEGHRLGSVLVEGMKVRSENEREWRSIRQVGAAAAAGAVVTYRGYRAAFAQAASSYRESIYSYSHRELDFELNTAQAKSACEADSQIPAGWIPYTGRLPVQG